MGDSPFIKFYPSDFLGGTSGLSPAERGVYITLLCLIYEADGSIKRNDSRLARCCGAPKAAFIRIIDGLIAQGKITQIGDMISNKRAEKAIVDRTNRTQIATHAAKQRWGAQTEKTQQNQRKNDAPAMPGQCVGDASQNQSQNQIDTNVSITPLPPKGDDRFDDFWASVPKKAGKGQAQRAWKSAIKKADPDVIISAMQAYAQQRSGKDAQYTAHPATWLNGERWLDEAAPSQQDFHKLVSQALGENHGLQPAGQIDHIQPQRIFAALQAPGSSGPRGCSGGDAGDGRGDKPAYTIDIRPKRFGGAD